jgi:hypothetical protein
MAAKHDEAALLDALLRDASPMQVARICTTLGLAYEKDAPTMMVLLTHLSDLIIRQQMMIDQAKLMPRVDFQHSGSKH